MGRAIQEFLKKTAAKRHVGKTKPLPKRRWALSNNAEQQVTKERKGRAR